MELIWGSNLFDYNFGLQYVNLATALAVILTLTTDNISLLTNLTLALVVSYSLQEITGALRQKIEQSWLIEAILFLLVLILMNFIPVWEGILGLIPAQFLDELATGGGLLPSLGLAVILAQALILRPLDRGIKFTYFIAILITALASLYISYWSILVFLASWTLFYFLLDREIVTKNLLRFIVGALVIIMTPFLVEIIGPLVDSQLKLVLWSEGFTSLFALLLLSFEVTQLELYFLILVIGVIFSRAGLLL